MPREEPLSPGIPVLPLSPIEKIERDRGSIEAAVETARNERRALGWAALAAVAAIGWIVMPVGVGILLGTLLAFTLQPLFERLKKYLGPRWSALALVIGSALTLAVGLSGLVSLLVVRGTMLTREWTASLGPDGSATAVFTALGRLTRRFGVPPDELAARARALAETAAVGAASVAEIILATTASTVLALFFAMLSMNFILRNWEMVALRAEEALPLRPDYTAALFAEFRRVGRATMVGTLGSGIAQGVFATLGYWFAGVPQPLFFGAATAVASLVPAVGTALVWVPVGIVMILVGHTTGGVFELGWGAAAVSALCDYVIRPRLIGGSQSLPSLVTFASLLGGVQIFGLKGLILGPVSMSLAFAVLNLYATEARKRRSDLIAR
jgi:predicted PurR-regulated permease PerM